MTWRGEQRDVQVPGLALSSFWTQHPCPSIPLLPAHTWPRFSNASKPAPPLCRDPRPSTPARVSQTCWGMSALEPRGSLCSLKTQKTTLVTPAIHSKPGFHASSELGPRTPHSPSAARRGSSTHHKAFPSLPSARPIPIRGAKFSSLVQTQPFSKAGVRPSFRGQRLPEGPPKDIKKPLPGSAASGDVAREAVLWKERGFPQGGRTKLPVSTGVRPEDEGLPKSHAEEAV